MAFLGVLKELYCCVLLLQHLNLIDFFYDSPSIIRLNLYDEGVHSKLVFERE
jgi:hypothetical protein